MTARPEVIGVDSTDDLGRVSSRLLSELWLGLTRHGIRPDELLGDLPIEVDEKGLVKAPVHWDHFNLFLQRLERHVGGPEGLERCGEWIGRGRTPHLFRSLLALATSPVSLYRAAAIWAAPRAMSGVEIDVVATAPNQLALEVRTPSQLGPCAPVLHLTTGVFRTLPRMLGMPDAVVESRIEAQRGHYSITLPSSRTGLARLRRFLRSLFVPGSVLRQLEARQLELNARHAALVRAHEAAIASEARLRALSDASVDMLCELDRAGRIVFVSASVRELMGYSPAQVAGSHYRLWIPTSYHALTDARFEALRAAPIGTAIARQSVELHAAHGRRVRVEGSIRSYRGIEGEWRAVAIFRDLSTKPGRAVDRETSARTAASPALEAALFSSPTDSSGDATIGSSDSGAPDRLFEAEHGTGAFPTSAAGTSTGATTPTLTPAPTAPGTSSRPMAARAAQSGRPRAGRRAPVEPANLLERLESGLIGFGARHTGHPLERSLARLVALLEGIERGILPERPDRVFEATRRMTRIVEHALLGEQGAAERSQWIETRKLVDRVREAHAARPEPNAPALRFEIGRGPVEIFGPESLLETTVEGLVDWARERIRLEPGWTDKPIGVALSIESRPAVLEEASALFLAVAIEAPRTAPSSAPTSAAPTSEVADAELILAWVGDAARLLGGELESGPPAHEGLGRTVRLPQPATAPELETAFAPVVDPCSMP